METLLAKPKLRLNKKVISRLRTFRSRGNIVADYTDFCATIKCTIPECGSIIMNCKTDNYASCAPCAPPTKDPTPVSKGGC